MQSLFTILILHLSLLLQMVSITLPQYLNFMIHFPLSCFLLLLYLLHLLPSLLLSSHHLLLSFHLLLHHITSQLLSIFQREINTLSSSPICRCSLTNCIQRHLQHTVSINDCIRSYIYSLEVDFPEELGFVVFLPNFNSKWNVGRVYDITPITTN
jgi:hypothetical protein